MNHGLTHIDHPVIGVRDMAAAKSAYERLGFIVPPRGSHPAWGTGNWCIQFDRDYLELRGIVDPSKAAREAHGLADFLAPREGLMGVAFGTVGAERSHASLVAAGLHPKPVKPLHRDFELPEGTVPVSFKLCFLEPADVPGLMLVVICEHLTPERLRRPEWLRHPNGVTRVRGVTGTVRDPGAAASAHRRIFANLTATDAEVRIVLPDGGWLSLLSPAAFAALARELTFSPPLAAGELAFITLEVSKIETTAAWFGRQRVHYVRKENRLWVQPRDACGVGLEFVEG